MNSVAKSLTPRATNMIRLDHTHVMATFHQYRTSDLARVKRGLVDQICLALEVHAQLEEEIFYPALRAVTEDPAIRKSKPEHDEMRRMIALLRATPADDPSFDDKLMELMRDVLHHVADEETILLPEAERLLGDRLEALGGRMLRRRIELLGPRALELAGAMTRSVAPSTAVLGVVMVASACIALKCFQPGYRRLS